MASSPMQPWDAERLRRSVVMTTPGHPAALDRSSALQVIEALQELLERHRRIGELLGSSSCVCAELRLVLAGEDASLA